MKLLEKKKNTKRFFIESDKIEVDNFTQTSQTLKAMLNSSEVIPFQVSVTNNPLLLLYAQNTSFRPCPYYPS